MVTWQYYLVGGAGLLLICLFWQGIVWLTRLFADLRTKWETVSGLEVGGKEYQVRVDAHMGNIQTLQILRPGLVKKVVVLHHYVNSSVSFERTWLSRQETIDILEKLQDSNRTNRRLWSEDVLELADAVQQKGLWLWLPNASKNDYDHDDHEEDDNQ